MKTSRFNSWITRIKENERAWRAFLLAFVLLLAWTGTYVAEHLMIATSDSLSKRVFWKTGSVDINGLKKGDYVMFHFSNQRVQNGKDILLVKRVGCLPGEQVTIEGREFYCGKEYLGHGKERDRKGQKVDLAAVTGKVPQQQLFVIGDHKDSYDSRYWGFLAYHKIVSLVIPIW